MMQNRIGYIPLNTYPDVPADMAVQSALAMASALECRAHVALFAVEIPLIVSPVAGVFINAEGMARAAEERSKAESARLTEVIRAADPLAQIVQHQPVLGGALHEAAIEARYFDLAILPWSAQTASAPDMAQAMVFDSGQPVVIVPAQPMLSKVAHVAIAWDESRVAARALADALRLLPEGGKISVLTVEGEKSLRGPTIAETLASALHARGYQAKAVTLSRTEGLPISTTLQQAALAEGAQMLAMGGFGHSRLRDFVLGGATQGVLADLRLPVLLSH